MNEVRVAFAVMPGELEAVEELCRALAEAAQSLSLPLTCLAVSDGPSAEEVEAVFRSFGLGGRALPPPAWGERLGLRETLARMSPHLAPGEGLLLNPASLPSSARLEALLTQSASASGVPLDWASSHAHLPPRASGFFTALITCARCGLILRSERGVGTDERVQEECKGFPSSK